MASNSRAKSWAGDNTQTKAEKIRFEMHDNETMVVDIGFNLRRQNGDYITVLKKHGGYWAESSRNWKFPLDKKKQLITEFEALLEKDGRPTSALEDIPFFVHHFILPITSPFKFKVRRVGQAQAEGYSIAYNEAKESSRSLDDLKLEIRLQLYDFQKEGIKFGIEKMGRVLIGDEMGVGKTIQALGLCALYRDEWPILVICPASLRYNWEKEARAWLGCYFEENDTIHVVWKKSDRVEKKEAKVVIISYDLAKELAKEIEDRLFHVIVCDEAHFMKSMDAKRTQNLLPVLQKAKRIILLTGTPAFAKPFELYPLLAAIRPDIFRDAKQFGERYCDPTFNRFSKKRDYVGCDHDVELNMILKNVMIRRLKKDVLKDLPPKIRQVRDIKGSPVVIREIKDLLKSVEKETGMDVNRLVEKMGGFSEGASTTGPKKGGEGGEGFNLLAVSAKIYDLTAKAKLEGVIEILTEFEEYKTKLVIFAFHKVMLDRLEQYAIEIEKKTGKTSIRIDGETAQMLRGPMTDKFMTDPNCCYAILGITAASVGLTLTQSRIVIFAELYWTPAIMFQAEDRIHRIGQTADSVLAIYLVAKDTIDQSMFDCLKNKVKTTGKILDGENAQTLTFENYSKTIDGTLMGYFEKKNAISKGEIISSKGLNSKGGASLFGKEPRIEHTSFAGISKMPSLIGSKATVFNSISEADMKELDELDDLEDLVRTKVKISPECERMHVASPFDEEKRSEVKLKKEETEKKSACIYEREVISTRDFTDDLINKELEDLLGREISNNVLKPMQNVDMGGMTDSKDLEKDGFHRSNSCAKVKKEEDDSNHVRESMLSRSEASRGAHQSSAQNSQSLSRAFKSPGIRF